MSTDNQPVLRLCVRTETLPLDQCAVPERCERRNCALCGAEVHYDPKASIPLLGPEQITCDICLDRLVEQGVFG